MKFKTLTVKESTFIKGGTKKEKNNKSTPLPSPSEMGDSEVNPCPPPEPDEL